MSDLTALLERNAARSHSFALSTDPQRLRCVVILFFYCYKKFRNALITGSEHFPLLEGLQTRSRLLRLFLNLVMIVGTVQVFEYYYLQNMCLLLDFLLADSDGDGLKYSLNNIV